MYYIIVTILNQQFGIMHIKWDIDSMFSLLQENDSKVIETINRKMREKYG